MSTARDIIKGSLRLIGAIATGETPAAEEISDGLYALNEMIDSWSNEKLIVHQIHKEKFTLTPSTQSYTLGTGGTFNSARPLKIIEAGLEIQGADPYEIPMDLLTVEEWAELSDKETLSSIPTKLYCEGTFPLETLNLWPIPSEANKIVLYSWKPLTTFASANTEAMLPPGYLRALRYNLALELAPEYGKEPSSLVMNSAMEAKENIKRMNIKPQFLDAKTGVTGNGFFNILTGE